MLEYWNDGKMGSGLRLGEENGIMFYWIVDTSESEHTTRQFTLKGGHKYLRLEKWSFKISVKRETVIGNLNQWRNNNAST